MKKILSLILMLAIVLSFTACVKEDTKDASNTQPENEQVTENNADEKLPEDEASGEEETETESETKPEEKPESTPETKPESTPETKPESTPEVSQSVGNTLLADFKTKADSYSSAVSLAEALLANPVIQFSGAAMQVEPGYLTGFDNTEISGFKEGAMFAPMIGTIPFVGYVFILEDGVNATDFISTLKSAANLRWNICTTADEMVTGSSGNKVFFVMNPLSFE